MKLSVIKGPSLCWSPPRSCCCSTPTPWNHSHFLARVKNPLRLISNTHPPPSKITEELIKYCILLKHMKFSDVCLVLITSVQAPGPLMWWQANTCGFISLKKPARQNAKGNQPQIHKNSRNSCRDFSLFNRYKHGWYPIPTDFRLEFKP